MTMLTMSTQTAGIMNIDEGEEAGALTVMEHSFTLSAFPNATFLFGV